MYLPPSFHAPSDAASLELVALNPLASVVWQEGGALQSTPLPWLLGEGAAPLAGLRAHLPRANALVRAVTDAAGGLPALLIFQGPQAYISPNWYPSKAETERNVPTWNYATVHLHGKLVLHDDAEWVREQLHALTAKHEAAEPRPWRLDDAAPGFIDQLLRVLVGLSFQLERTEAKFKLSQNRAPADFQGVVDALAASSDPGAQATAQLMKRSVAAG